MTDKHKYGHFPDTGKFNDEIIITESGIWIVPYTDIYEVTLINGGNGGRINGASDANGGEAGSRETKLLQLIKDQTIDIVVGTGGIGGELNTVGNMMYGGQTKFGNWYCTSIRRVYASAFLNFWVNMSYYLETAGAGEGGGSGWYNTAHPEGQNGIWYGAGGGAFLAFKGNGTPSRAGNGYQGCVIIRYHNPDK